MSIADDKTVATNDADDNFQNMKDDDKMTWPKLKVLIKENLYSGITVALVSAPLSSALAMASGATAMMGLITAIYGPAISGVLGGSHYNILGPAGALVNILSALKAVNGTDIIPWVAFYAGLISFFVYMLKLENYCTMLPTSVLEGFSLGVATTIGLGQIGFAFGNQYGLGPELKKCTEFYEKVIVYLTNLDQMQSKEFFCFLPFYVALMSLLRWKPQIPWIIVIAVIGIIYGIVMKEVIADPVKTPTLLKDVYPSLSESVQLAQFDYWTPKQEIPFMNILVGALKVAFVAVLETLISARIADNKTNTRFDQSKEIFGMSIANMVSGILGGCPCTGVLIRTNVNIQTGATHKTSQFINAVVVFFIVVLFMNVFTYIPMAVIASILMTSACRLVPKTIMRQLWNVDKVEFWILIVTWLICVFKDGAVGLLIGSFLAFLKQSEKSSETQLQIDMEEKLMKVELDGSLDYINGLHFEIKVFDEINEQQPEFVTVNLSRIVFVDIDGLFILQNLFKKKDVKVVMVYDKSEIESVLTKSSLFQGLKKEDKVFSSISEARAAFLSGKGKEA